ncbi:MAG: putative efflux system outer membrane protein [Phycisphaerales bacterium]|nr:putative efflux system outer membrane protein [Phycisphaerales bacterium]
MQRKLVPALILATAFVTITGCASNEQRFDPRSLGNSEREGATSFKAEPLKPLPTTLQSQFLPDDNGNLNPNAPREAPVKKELAPPSAVVRMPLREVTQRAVANNLAVRVSGYQPAIDETRITEADARFDPEAFANVTFIADRTAPSNALTVPNNDQLQIETGLRQLLPSGGQVELSYKPTHVNVQDDNSSAAPRGIGQNGYWTSQIQLQLTQPLLQNFGNEVNQARIVINRYNQRISILDFRKDLEDTISKVEEGYWRLYQAQRTQAILEALLQRTIDTADIVSKRFGQDVTLEQISTSVSRVESARADLIRARQRVKDLADELKSLMNDPQYPVASETLILAADDPLLSPITFDFKDSIDTALVNRFDLAQQQLRIESAGVSLNVAKNNQLPQLNVVGSIGTFGGGQRDGFNQQYGQALHDNFDGDADINWSLGLQFTQKLGNREANAIYRRAQLQRLQAIASYQQLIEQASFEVKTATRDVETNWQAIGQTRSARFAAAKALDVVVDRETNGGQALSPDFIERKLQRQQELANAEQAEAEAAALYNIALSKLEQRKGTLLRYNNVILDEKMYQR